MQRPQMDARGRAWWHPFYTVTITTPGQARLYNRLLLIRIALQLLLLGAMLWLFGWNWQMLLGGLAVAVAWQGINRWRRI